MATSYTCEGDHSGGCGKVHCTIRTAARCLVKHQGESTKRWSDRDVVAIGRELTMEEVIEIERLTIPAYEQPSERACNQAVSL